MNKKNFKEYPTVNVANDKLTRKQAKEYPTVNVANIEDIASGGSGSGITQEEVNQMITDAFANFLEEDPNFEQIKPILLQAIENMDQENFADVDYDPTTKTLSFKNEIDGEIVKEVELSNLITNEVIMPIVDNVKWKDDDPSTKMIEIISVDGKTKNTIDLTNYIKDDEIAIFEGKKTSSTTKEFFRWYNEIDSEGNRIELSAYSGISELSTDYRGFAGIMARLYDNSKAVLSSKYLDFFKEPETKRLYLVYKKGINIEDKVKPYELAVNRDVYNSIGERLKDNIVLTFNKSGISSNNSIANGTTKNLFDFLTQSDLVDIKNATGFTLENGILKFPPVKDVRSYAIEFNITGTIGGTSGTPREWEFQFTRPDNSILRTKSGFKISGTSIGKNSYSFDTWTKELSDNLITKGSKILLNNTSGQTITITGISGMIKGS